MKRIAVAIIMLASLNEAALAQHSTCPVLTVAPGARSTTIDIKDPAGARLVDRAARGPSPHPGDAEHR